MRLVARRCCKTRLPLLPANNVNIAADGIVAGNTAFTTPVLIVIGAVSPGSSGIGAITNNGDIVLGVGGSFDVAVQGVCAVPGVAWDFVQAGGRLNVQSTAANLYHQLGIVCRRRAREYWAGLVTLPISTG